MQDGFVGNVALDEIAAEEFELSDGFALLNLHVGFESAFELVHQHFQRRRAALPRSPVQERLRAQKDLRRAAALLPGLTLPVTGALRLLPVARL